MTVPKETTSLTLAHQCPPHKPVPRGLTRSDQPTEVTESPSTERSQSRVTWRKWRVGEPAQSSGPLGAIPPWPRDLGQQSQKDMPRFQGSGSRLYPHDWVPAQNCCGASVAAKALAPGWTTPHPQELLNASHPNPRSPMAHMISLVSPPHHPTGTHTHTWGDTLDTHTQAHGMAHTPPQAQGHTWLVQALHR